MFAGLFGVGPLTDAYLVAYRIPNLLRDLFAEGALSSAFVPTFAEALRREGQERAHRLGNLVISGLLVIVGAITLAGIAGAEPVVHLIAGDFQGDPAVVAAAKGAAGALFAQIMMPILLLVSVSAVWMAMLNAQERYTAPAFAPALFNLTSIVCGVAIYLTGAGDLAALALWSAAVTLAGVVQAVVQLPSLWRLGFRPRLVFAGLAADPAVRRILRLMTPAVLGLAAIQINVFVNTQFAGALGTGPITNLNNAFRLFHLPVGLFGVAMATVTTARASAEAARGDRAALGERVSEGARAVWLLALPSAVGLILLAEPVVALLFQHGQFRRADTLATVPVVQAYMVGVVPYSLVKVYAPGFFALARPRIPMFASLGAVLANLLFNGLTYQRLGAPGLALGTSLAAFVNLAVLRLALGRVAGPGVGGAGGGRDLLKVIAATAVLAAVVAGSWAGCARAVAWLEGGAPAWASAGRGGLLFLVIGVGFAVYVVTLRALRHPGGGELGGLPARVWGRLRGGR